MWSFGPSVNTRRCDAITDGRQAGSRAFRDALRSCSLTGRWGCGVAPWRGRVELRGSWTVLREPRGETPPGYSPQYPRGQGTGGGARHAWRDGRPAAAAPGPGEAG